MADVTPNDVVIMVWRTLDPPVVQMIQVGDPKLPTAAAVSGAIQIKFPEIFALATVTVRGTPGAEVGLWRFGFIQLGFINTDWAHYRNPDPADGSVFVARDRPPALDQQLCRDSVAKTGITGALQRFPYVGPIIFYDTETQINDWWNRRNTGFLPLVTKIHAGGQLIFTVLISDSPAPQSCGLNRLIT